MVIFPVAPDQTIAQIWSNGAADRQLTSEGMRSTTVTMLQPLPAKHKRLTFH